MRTIILILFCTQIVLCIGGNGNNVPVEQHAFDYFISQLDSTYIFTGSFKRFNTDSNKVYYHPRTHNKMKLSIDYAKYSKKPGFIVKKQDEDGYVYMYADTVSYELKGNLPFLAIDSSRQFSRKKQNGDIAVIFSSRMFYNGFYYVRIYIDAGIESMSNEAVIKLDSDGKPLDILFQYGIN